MSLLPLRGGTARRPDARPLHSPNDIKGTGFLVWEHPDERGRALSLSARAGPRAPHRRRGEAGELRRQRLQLRGHRRPRDRRLQLRVRRRERDLDGPGGHARHPAWRSSRAPRIRAPTTRASVSSSSRTASSSSTPTSSTARNERAKVYDVKRLARVDGIWTVMELVVANERDRTRTELDDRRRSLQHRPRPRTTSRRRALEQGRANERRATGAIRHLPLPLSCCAPLIIAGRSCLAPRVNFTEIDNDITTWFSREDPVFQHYERFRKEFGGPRNLHHRPRSRDRLFTPSRSSSSAR